MNNIAPLAPIPERPCGACIVLGTECLTGCFWLPFFPKKDVEKFSLLIEDTPPKILKAKLIKCRTEIRHSYINNQYKRKKEKKSEQAVLAADSESLNHREGEVVHDFGTGLETCKRVHTPLSTKSCSNVAKDSLNHCEWPVKRVCTRRPTIPLAEKAVGPSEKALLLNQIINMNNIAPLAPIPERPCGACIVLGTECLTGCFWLPFFPKKDVEKFSLLIEDTPPEILKAKLIKCGTEIQQNYINNQYKRKKETKSEQAVLAADSESLNHREGEVVHDFGTGLETRKCVRTPLSTKSCSNVAKDSLNHCEWPVKRVRTWRPTIPLAENAVGPSEKVVPLAEKAVGPSDNALLLVARSAEIIEFADTFSEENRTNILEHKKQHDKNWFDFMLSKMGAKINEIADRYSEEDRTKILEQKKHDKVCFEILLSKIVSDLVAKKEQASLRNEKAEQPEKEQASLRNEKAEQAEKEQAKRSEK